MPRRALSGPWALGSLPPPPGLPAYLISFSSRMNMFSVSSWQAKPMFTAVSANQPSSGSPLLCLVATPTLPPRPSSQFSQWQ